MQTTIVAIVCHLVVVNPEKPAIDVCHETMVHSDDDMSPMDCMSVYPKIVDWKLKSKYSSDEWRISKIRCSPGNPPPARDAT